jgi:DNA-binding transcriptional LysR family regulator
MLTLKSVLMNLNLFKYFCEVVETESITLAALKLHVVPAAVSMQIGQLESLLGGKVFDRSTRPMRLTPLGHFLYPKAKALLSDTGRLIDQARDVTSGHLGWLSIGFTRSTIFSVLPDAVRQMSADLPKVRIDLTEILTEHQAEALRSGLIHIGLSRTIGHFTLEEDMDCIPLFDDTLVAAIASTSLLAKRKSLNAQDLAEASFISYPKDPNSSFSRHNIQALEKAGVKVRVGYEAKEIHTALGLVAAGLGYTLVGKSVADNNSSSIRFRPVKGLDAVAQVFAVRRKDTPNPLVDVFLKIATAQSLAR